MIKDYYFEVCNLKRSRRYRIAGITLESADKVMFKPNGNEQQQQQTGSKSLNSSPIPATLGKVPGQVISNSTVVVQKPIAILPGASSGSLIRRCVTVCEDPVKAIHLQQQHQQLRSQLAGTSMVTAGGTLTRTKPTHSSSLAEPTTSSILKQPSKSQQQQIRSINQQYHSGTTTTGSIGKP